MSKCWKREQVLETWPDFLHFFAILWCAFVCCTSAFVCCTRKKALQGILSSLSRASSFLTFDLVSAYLITAVIALPLVLLCSKND
jgi:hypothetical protein